MIRYLYLLLLLIASVSLQGQDCNGIVSGYVFDRTSQEALLGATIAIKGVEIGAATDADGFFRIENICEEDFDLIISYIGYQTLTHHHDAHHKQDVTIYLAPDFTTIESIIIEAEHSTGNIATAQVTSIPKVDLLRMNNKTLASVTSHIPGVSILKTGQNINNPMIHGMSTNRLVIINKGIRHSFQNWDDAHAPEINFSDVDNIDIIKGAGAMQYGVEAMGGAFVLNGKTVEFNAPLDGRVGLGYSTNGKRIETDLEISKGLDNISFKMSGGYTLQGDLQASQYTLTNTGRTEQRLAGDIRWHPHHNWDITQSLNYFQSELGVLKGAVNGNLQDLVTALDATRPDIIDPFSYDIDNPRQKLRHIAGITQAKYIEKHQALTFRYGIQANDRKEFDVRRGNNNSNPNIDLTLLTQSLDIDFNHPDVLNKLQGKAGVNVTMKNNNNNPGTNTVPFIPNYNNLSLGGYLIEKISLGNGTLESALRYDWIYYNIVGRDPANMLYRSKQHWTDISYYLGWSSKINDHWTYSFNVGRAWRPPNIADLYRYGRNGIVLEYGLWRYAIDENNNIDVSSIKSNNSNQDLKERALKITPSIRFESKKVSADFTAYTQIFDNFIFSRPVGLSSTVRGAAPLFIFDQTRAFWAGADASVTTHYHKSLKGRFAAQYIYSRDLDNKTYFTQTPPPSINYNLMHLWSDNKKNLTTNIGINYTLRQKLGPQIISPTTLLDYANNGLSLPTNTFFDIAAPPTAYLLMNFSSSLRIKSWDFTIGIDNVLNTAYRVYTDRQRYYADDLGRNIYFKMQFFL